MDYKLKDVFCETCTSIAVPFVTFDLRSQLDNILTQEKIESINSNIITTCQLTGLTNAMNASIYKEFISKENPDKNLAISFNLNTDGAAILNFRNLYMWPLLGTITELDPSSREKFENIVIFGLWLAVSKPPELFFEKSLEKLQTIIRDNVEVNGKNYFIHIHIH